MIEARNNVVGSQGSRSISPVSPLTRMSVPYVGRRAGISRGIYLQTYRA